MELTGLLHVIFDTASKSDKFKSREVILRTEFDSPYPQTVSLQFSQSKADLLNDFKVGDMVKVQFNVRGREWNGPQGTKYFNTLDAWSISLIPNRTSEAPVQKQQSAAVAPAFNNDDVPF